MSQLPQVRLQHLLLCPNSPSDPFILVCPNSPSDPFILVSVLFDDGDFDANVPVSCLVYRKLGDTPEKLNSEIKRGDPVWSPFRSNYKKPESIFPGKVIAIKPANAGGEKGSKAEVSKEEEMTLYIQFDDGDEDQVPLSQVFPGQGNPLFGETEYDSKQLCAPGSIVLATYRGRQRLYPGKVAVKALPVAAAAVTEEGEELVEVPSEPVQKTYCIVAYDDGDFDPRVDESTLKPPSDEMLNDGSNNEAALGRRIQAPWKEGTKLWPGRVLKADEALKYVEDKIKTSLVAKVAKIEEEAAAQVTALKNQVAASLASSGETFVFVQFDDGDEDKNVPLSLVVPKEEYSTPWPPSDPESLVSLKVMAPYKGSGSYPGTIASASGKVVLVKFDDGDEDKNVPLIQCMQRDSPDLPVDPQQAETLTGLKVMAPYKGSHTLYPGTIAEESKEEEAANHLASLFALAKKLV